jgi:hypothetical protein
MQRPAAESRPTRYIRFQLFAAAPRCASGSYPSATRKNL